MIYLASPYSHRLPGVPKARYQAVCYAAAMFAAATIPVYSPIIHWHPIAERFQVEGNYNTWRIQNEAMMPLCEACVILTLEGHELSEGVRAEYDFFQHREITCHLVSLPHLPGWLRISGVARYGVDKTVTAKDGGSSRIERDLARLSHYGFAQV